MVSTCYPYLALLVAAFVLTPFSATRVNAYTTPLVCEALAGEAAPTPSASCLPCRTPPIREALARADAVFIGKAIEGDEKKEWANPNGEKIDLLSGRIRFSVEWVFSGVKRSEAIVITLDDYCIGFDHFTKGERYLLYARGNESRGFYVVRCSRSESVSSAGEDLKILSSLSPKTCGVRLYGMAGYATGIKITATDAQGHNLEAVSRVGHFEIEGVRPNVEYTVQAHLPNYYQKNDANPKKVRINPCGWANVGFSADYDSSISGRVIGPDGNPLNNAVVELMPFNKTGPWSDKSAISDSQGRFELRDVAPGAYLLGVNITEAPKMDRPYPPTWYPNADTRQSAAIIEMEPGQKLSGYEIAISRRLAERTIEGTVFWPDGRPAANADVYLSASIQPGSGAAKAVYTDYQGRFKVTGYEGIAYFVVASSAPNRDEPPVLKWFYAEPPLVELKEENVAGLELTLTWDEEDLRDFFKKKR